MRYQPATTHPCMYARAALRLLKALSVLALLALFAGCALPAVLVPPHATATATATATPTPTPTPPIDTATPTYTPAEQLMAQVVPVGPVYVTGDNNVPAEALKDAGLTLAIMLQHRPDVGVRLRQGGAFTAVADHNQQICDLPYFSQYGPDLCQSYGQGGAGGTMDSPVTACDERNLLKEPDDPYLRGAQAVGQNICVHELAHTIMNVGLSDEDRTLIEARFEQVQVEGLWTDDYAMTNDMEFWAVMSQFYFSAGPNATYDPSFHHIANGPAKLKAYDPATFDLLDSIYQGSADLS